MNRSHPSCRFSGLPAPRQHGFTLVELMVSMVISLVILAALVGIFVNSSNRNREMERTNGMIENGRLAVQVLENDIVHAGFWGNFVPQFDDQTYVIAAPGDVPTAVPDPCRDYLANPWDAQYKSNLVGIVLDSIDDESICSGVVTNKRANTDVLFVRHADTCVVGDPAPCQAYNAANLYFQPSRCLTDLVPYVLDDDPTAFTLRQRGCTAAAEKRKFISNIYYVRDHAVTAGDGIPTLMRSQFGAVAHQAPVALIEGIEGFIVEFGVDDVSKTGAAVNYAQVINYADPMTRTTPTNRGDGSPDGPYVHCTTAAPCGVAELMNVTAVKMYVLARSREPTQGYTDTKVYLMGGGITMGPFNDGFKRHLFVTTVRLPNYAGRRMTP
jgi:type IV pilus assembly protein PilW